MEKIKSKDLQTNLPKGIFKQGDQHPIYEKYIFWGFRSDKQEQWMTKEKAEIAKTKKKEYNKNFANGEPANNYIKNNRFEENLFWLYKYRYKRFLNLKLLFQN